MVTVFNIHGLVDEAGKIDSDKRFLQLKNIQNFVTGFDHPVILAGDFNVTLNTQFVHSLEKLIPILSKNIMYNRQDLLFTLAQIGMLITSSYQMGARELFLRVL